MDSLPVSMVPLKKRAWKPNDNQIDLNIRSPTSIFTRNEGLELLGRTIFSRENGLSEVHLDLEGPKNSGLESIPAFSSPIESNGDCDKLRETDITKSIDSKKPNLGVAPKMRLPCTTCGQEFQSKKKLLNHMFHHDDEPNKIEKIEILDEDNNSVSSGNQEIFLCDSCPENFRTESQLQKHFRAKHDQQNTNITNKTKNNQAMNGASRLSANKPVQQISKQTGKFECEICSVKFMKRGMLLCHITKTHPTASKGQFRSLTDTVRHHDKVWLCPYCDRKYQSSGKRREHIKKSHPNCVIPPSIKQAGIEAAHVSFVSTSHKEPHNCPYCPMEYAHRTKLLKHCKEKHKDQPVPYKYKKWKARDLVEREVNQKARDIEKLIAGSKTEKSNIRHRPGNAGNQTEPVPIPPKYTNKVSVLPTKTEESQIMNLNEPEDSLPDFFCDTAPPDSNPSPIDRITDITDESRDSTNQSYPSFSYGHNFPDPVMIDEDTRHSVGSFQSISDAGHNGSSMGQNGSSMAGQDFNQIGGFRNHVTTPNSEILCKNERENITPEAHSQSLPALSQPSDLLHFLPLPQAKQDLTPCPVSSTLNDHDLSRNNFKFDASNFVFSNETRMTHQNESRSRNPTFDATTLRHSQSTLGGDLPMIDICDDSAQSAPPNFTFDTDSLIREVESESRDTNQDLSGDLLQQACQAINTTINMENDDRPNFFKLSELNNNPEIKIKNESLELNHGQMGQIITSGGLQISSGQENNSQSIAVIRQTPSNPNFFLASQPISTSSRQSHQTQTYRLVTTEEVRTVGGTSGGGGHGHFQTMRPQMVNQTTPQVVNQTGQQVIQYIPQSPQSTGNIITIMPTNSNWSNQQVLKTSPVRRRNKSPAIIRNQRRFQSPRKSPRQIRPKPGSSIQNLTPVLIGNFDPSCQYVINGSGSSLNGFNGPAQMIFATDLPK